MPETFKPKCYFCGSHRMEHGDHCADCGCPRCGFPGARYTEGDGFTRGFCSECEWEAVPGAYAAWKARQPKMSPEQKFHQMMKAFGLAEDTDEVGAPIYTTLGFTEETQEGGQ